MYASKCALFAHLRKKKSCLSPWVLVLTTKKNKVYSRQNFFFPQFQIPKDNSSYAKNSIFPHTKSSVWEKKYKKFFLEISIFFVHFCSRPSSRQGRAPELLR